MKKKYFKLTAILLLQLWTWSFQRVSAQETASLKFSNTGLLSMNTQNNSKNKIVISVPNDLLIKETNELIKNINKRWFSMLDSYRCLYKDTNFDLLQNLKQIDDSDFLLLVDGKQPKRVATIQGTEYLFELPIPAAGFIKLELSVDNILLNRIRRIMESANNEINGDINVKNAENVASLFYRSLGEQTIRDKDFDLNNFDTIIAELNNAGGCRGFYNLGLNKQVLNYLKLNFLSSLFNTQITQQISDEDRVNHFTNLIKLKESQITFLDSLIADNRIVTQLTIEKDKKTSKPDKDALAALIDRREEFQKLIQDYKDSLAIKVFVKSKMIWYNSFKLFSGKVFLKSPDNFTIVTILDANEPLAPLNKLNHPLLTYHRGQEYNLTVLNLPGEKEYEIDTATKFNVVEKTTLNDVITTTPGFKEMFPYITNWLLPDFTTRVINSAKIRTILKIRSESWTNNNVDTSILKDFIVCEECNCDTMNLKCVFKNEIKVPEKYKSKLKDTICLTNCTIQFLGLLNWRANVFEATSSLSGDDGASKLAYTSIAKQYNLKNFEGSTVTFTLKGNSREEQKLESFYVSKTYCVLPAMGFAYQWGYPYALSVDPNNGLQRTYQNKIALTAGIKYFPFGGTRIYKEPLRISRNPSKYAKPSINNFQTKLFFYGGFTISDKPYENLYFGAGIEPISGISVAVIHRWVFENKIVVNGSQVYQVNGYSGFADPGAFGFSLLIDPVVVAGIFGNKNKEDKK